MRTRRFVTVFGGAVLAGSLVSIDQARSQSGPIAPASSSSSTGSAAPLASSTGSSSVSKSLTEEHRKLEAALVLAKLGGVAYTGSVGRPFTPDEIREVVEQAQGLRVSGRLSELVAKLTAVVESPRFSLAEREPEGRAAMYSLGEALSELGVHALARAYLRKTAAGPTTEATTRAATRRLTEIALDTEGYAQGIEDLTTISEKSKTDEVRGELDYLVGRKAEAEGDVVAAAKAFARIVPVSRFWSTATYRRGLLAVNLGRLDDAEGLFCQVADPKRSNPAGVFADERFYAVRDLARLALGRVAHEGLRADDARYYYYLVPQDSKRLAESLYESATSRYEARDLDGARDLLDELSTLGEGHVYDDEAKVLDVYVDIGACKFDDADKKLTAFLKVQTPLRERVHSLATGSEAAVRAFIERGSVPTDTKATADADARIWRRLEADPALLFVVRARRRLAAELSGLDGAAKSLEAISETLSGKKVAVAVDPNLSLSAESREAQARDALEGLAKELAALTNAGAKSADIAALRVDHDRLAKKLKELEARGEEGAVAATPPKGSTLPELLINDTARAKELRTKGVAILAELDAAALALSKDALIRLDRRASRLLARARLAKIDVVLGRKKGLEIEVDALKQGILPRDALDALDAARYLDDKEEYWPFEGDEWTDEVIGVEVGER